MGWSELWRRRSCPWGRAASWAVRGFLHGCLDLLGYVEAGVDGLRRSALRLWDVLMCVVNCVCGGVQWC